MSSSITDDVLFRASYLTYSLMCENITSYLIAELVDITDHENSRTLGHKSSSLSFNQRIDFLIDMQVLNATQKAKFQTFMEIRNQLMHNISASTYVKCFTFLPAGKDQYRQLKGLSKEEELKKASLALAEDVFNITTSLFTSITKKEEKEKIVPGFERKIKVYENVHTEIESIIDEIVASRIQKRRLKSSAAFTGIGKEVAQIINKRFKEESAKARDKLKGI